MSGPRALSKVDCEIEDKDFQVLLLFPLYTLFSRSHHHRHDWGRLTGCVVVVLVLTYLYFCKGKTCEVNKCCNL